MSEKPLAFWDVLLPPAILGTARATLPQEVLRGLNALGMPTDEMTNAHILLEAAAFYAQTKKISVPHRTWSSALPLPASQPKTETLAYLSDDLSKSFIAILAQRKLCLQEFSLMAQDNQLYLPHQLLPIALNHALQFPETWDFIALLLDERAWWLMNQHPTWKALTDKPFCQQTVSSAKEQAALEQVKKVMGLLQHRSSVVLDQDWKHFKEAAYFLAPTEIAYWADFWLQHPALFDYRNRSLHDFIAVLNFRGDLLNQFHQLQE